MILDGAVAAACAAQMIRVMLWALDDFASGARRIGDIMRKMTLLAAALGCAFIVVGEVTASGTCFASIASGSGASALTVCLSDHGNIVQWTTPAGVEHSIKNDGYVLCSLGAAAPVVHGWDAGISTEDGFGAPVISQPNGVNTERRTTACSGWSNASRGMRRRRT
jgi:hypothetical protein